MGPRADCRIFNVADTLAGDITTQFSDAETNGFLLDETFVMPTAPNDNTRADAQAGIVEPAELAGLSESGRLRTEFVVG